MHNNALLANLMVKYSYKCSDLHKSYSTVVFYQLAALIKVKEVPDFPIFLSHLFSKCTYIHEKLTQLKHTIIQTMHDFIETKNEL